MLLCAGGLLVLLLTCGWDRLVGNTFLSWRGRVVSVDGSPVAGAAVTVDVVTYDFFQVPWLWKTMTASTRVFVLNTDANGEFRLGATHGSWLALRSISKNGFEKLPINHERSTFSFHGVNQDASRKPALYVLAPLGPSAGNVAANLTVRPRRDGTPHVIDLLGARADPAGPSAGQLRLAITGPADLRHRPPERFDWSLSLSGIGVQLCPTDEIVPMTAPEDGYRSGDVVSVAPTQKNWDRPDPQWTGEIHRRYYLRSEDRQFRAWIEVIASCNSPGIEDTANVVLIYVYNNNSSPNLFRPQKP